MPLDCFLSRWSLVDVGAYGALWARGSGEVSALRKCLRLRHQLDGTPKDNARVFVAAPRAKPLFARRESVEERG